MSHPKLLSAIAESSDQNDDHVNVEDCGLLLFCGCILILLGVFI